MLCTRPTSTQKTSCWIDGGMGALIHQDLPKYRGGLHRCVGTSSAAMHWSVAGACHACLFTLQSALFSGFGTGLLASRQLETADKHRVCLPTARSPQPTRCTLASLLRLLSQTLSDRRTVVEYGFLRVVHGIRRGIVRASSHPALPSPGTAVLAVSR